jgi:endonuclease G, mitochondrial
MISTKHLFYFFVLLLWTSTLFCQKSPLQIHSSNGQIINHTYYSLTYSEKHEQAEWVSYILNPSFLNGSTKRTDDFRIDKKVLSQSANSGDYLYSGWDRGHLVPAADMVFSNQSMSESFYYSNISPQNPLFNRGGWKKLEAQVRDWGKSFEIIVVTGGVLTDNGFKSIGENKVSIPKNFYKIVYAPEINEMIGFVMPNQKIYNDLLSYATTVDEIEGLTGINFFIELSEEQQNQLESTINLENWVFNVSASSENTKSSSNSTQCSAIAKSTGNRCRNFTKDVSQLCYIHREKEEEKPPNYLGRCLANTNNGKQCKRKAASGRMYCWQH